MRQKLALGIILDLTSCWSARLRTTPNYSLMVVQNWDVWLS